MSNNTSSLHISQLFTSGPSKSSLENPEKPKLFYYLEQLLQVSRSPIKDPKFTINLINTRYKVLTKIAKHDFEWQIIKELKEKGHGSRLKDNAFEGDIIWVDTYINQEMLTSLFPHQRINHFPSSHHLGRKDLLARNLNRIMRFLPDTFDFFPQTWSLPLQYEELRRHMQGYHDRSLTKRPVFIIKPEASCQGRGISLIKKLDDIESKDRYIVQEYISNPYLIDELKFDLRIYVMIRSVDPLKVYIYREGLARFATVPYTKPKKSNMKNMYMHLTNYAINKKNPDFQFNEEENHSDEGHKRSMSSIFKYLKEKGEDTDKLFEQICDQIIKTIISVQPQLVRSYRACQPRPENNKMCFEVLGFDVLIDANLKPWILEVNHTPSFQTDTPLDMQVKKNLLFDSLTLVNTNFDKNNNQPSTNRSSLVNQYNLYQKPSKPTKTSPDLSTLVSNRSTLTNPAQNQTQIPSQSQLPSQNLSQSQVMTSSHSQPQSKTPVSDRYWGGYMRIYPPFSNEKKIRYESMMNVATKVWQPHAHVGKASALEEALNPQRAFQPSSHLIVAAESRRTLNQALNISSNILKYPPIKAKATSVEGKYRRKHDSVHISPLPKGYVTNVNRSMNHDEASLELIDAEKAGDQTVWRDSVMLESLPIVQDIFKNFKSGARDIDNSNAKVNYVNINSTTQFLQEKSFDTSQEYLGPVINKRRGIWRGYTRRQQEEIGSQLSLKGHSTISLALSQKEGKDQSTIISKDGDESTTMPQLDSNKSLIWPKAEEEKTSRSLAEPERQLHAITGNNTALLNRASRIIKGYRPNNFESSPPRDGNDPKGGKNMWKSRVIVGSVHRNMSTSFNSEIPRAHVNLQEIVRSGNMGDQNQSMSGNFKKNTLMQMVRGRNFASVSDVKESEKVRSNLPLIEEDRRDEDLERTKGLFKKKFLLDVTLLGETHNKSSL